MKKMINRTHISGLLHDHSLQKRVTGKDSKNPNTEYITGDINIATDNAHENVVPVHFSYVTAKTAKGQENRNFKILNDIFEGKIRTIVDSGFDGAAKISVDSAIGLNEFYSDRNGTDELVSARRNEGGFITLVNALEPNEKTRATFETDMIITGVTVLDADEERELPERANVKGAIFNFRNDVLPVSFTALNPQAINYFEGLEASSSSPIFTKVKGEQVSQTIRRNIKEDSAFGEASVRTVISSRKDYVITWAAQDVYDWDDESTILASELVKALSDRELHLAELKQRSEESKMRSVKSAPATKEGVFNF
jgi:hypothetical protein